MLGTVLALTVTQNVRQGAATETTTRANQGGSFGGMTNLEVVDSARSRQAKQGLRGVVTDERKMGHREAIIV